MANDLAGIPVFSETEVLSLLETQYGLSGILKGLDSERDQNFRVSTERESYVLKIANGQEDDGFLQMQNEALKHIAEVAPMLCVPRLISTKTGEDMTALSKGDSVYKVRLLSYLEGRPLATVNLEPDGYESLGRKVGALSKALQSFDHASSLREEFIWGLDNASLVMPWADDILEEENKTRVKAIFKRYAQDVLPKLKSLRSSVTHQDANDYNILVNDSEISGIIDFGDMCKGRVINELAVMLAYALMDKSDPLSVAGYIIRGYCSVFPLWREELDALLDLILVRLAVSVSISSHRGKEEQDNEYLFISQKPAFDLIKKLSELDREYVISFFQDAAIACALDYEASGGGVEELLAERKDRLNPALSVSYKKPLKITRGRGAYLYSEEGERYLDCVNNISHIGHCHPKLVAAQHRQACKLNTNSRYLHDSIIQLAERISKTLPEKLSVVTFVNSGTEANELALRMARTASGRKETIVLDWAYHGNSTATIEISPYKFNRKGGAGQSDIVEIAEIPDPYRGKYKGYGEEAGIAYATSVQECIDNIIEKTGHGPACFIAESISGVAGQVLFPDGYFKAAYEKVRAAGGLCIADEVQCGFGRVGEAFWGFELQGVEPDIVVLGKPIGSGHPLAAVVTTREVADGFANGMEYFNSFGGNPVSMEIGKAVLDVIEGEGLQAHAKEVGGYLLEKFNQLKDKYSLIGDVRGSGLFLGIELVENRASLESATTKAGAIVNRLREKGILLSTDGPLENVLKFKPPMVFSREDADFLVRGLDQVLAEF